MSAILGEFKNMRRTAVAQLLNRDPQFVCCRIYHTIVGTGLAQTSSYSIAHRRIVESTHPQARSRVANKTSEPVHISKKTKMWSPKRQDSRQTSPDPPSGIVDSAFPTRANSPQPAHKPNTGQDEHQVYVLTLNLSPSLSVPLDQMREEYFPKHLNRTPAHVTLFHALPQSQMEAIDADLHRIARRTRPYHVSTGKPFRLRRGVAVLLGSGEESSQHLREELREKWAQWLSQQDNSGRGWQPHWTVMNKVEEEKKVNAAFNTLRRILFDDVHHGKALGFDLWKYNSGHWEHAKEYRFQGHDKSAVPSPDAAESEGYGYFEQRPKSRNMKSPEEGLKKSKSGTRMADVWRTVTLGKKKPAQEFEQR